jgi:hypothetical protein
MINKRLDQVDRTDVENLVVNGVPESNRLDYKEALPGNDDEGKKEFLRDVSAMANANGGDLIYGVREQRDREGGATAIEVVGITGINIDATRLWMENLIRDCIKPRLTRVDVRAVSAGDSKEVLIVRVPRSWNGPHVVEFKKHWRFYSRSAAGNYPMDVAQLRHAFTFADTLFQRLNEFRLERLARIVADESLAATAKVVLHIQPLTSLQPDVEVDVVKARRDVDNLNLIYAGISADAVRFNLDGLLARISREESAGYLQVFRNETIESVDTLQLSPEHNRTLSFDAGELEESIIRATNRYMALLRNLEILPPYALSLSLLGVEGYVLRDDRTDITVKAKNTPIDRPDLLIPMRLIDENPANAGQVLRPIFNAIWNAAGFGKCLHYDEDGNWRGSR